VSNEEVELNQHGEAGRQVSALLSAALAAAQAGAQVAAHRARERTRQAEQQTRRAEQQTREQQRQAQQDDAAVQRQLERQQRTELAVRHRQWGLKPTSQWLHDNPLSAAAAWASADVYRGGDPVAARHAEQWETVFQREGIDVDDVRANAPAAVAAAEQEQGTASAPATAEPAEVAGELSAAEVATAAVVAGAVDVAAAEVAEHAHNAAGSSQWSAYADGAPTAALGGRGVSTPPNQVLAQARETPDLAATASAGAARAVELVHTNGLDR
jgi:hypothetical protein